MAPKKHLVVLSGAGISVESGIPAFRGNDGLWAGHSIEDVATPQAWKRNPRLVLEFYNARRKNAIDKLPNEGHKLLAKLEAHYQVTVITQNVDNLHEKGGSSNVLHLHGELFKSRSTADSSRIYDVDGWALNWGDCCELGAQLRPHIVWFGEEVPALYEAANIAASADVFIIIGTSLNVYPAAGLIEYAPAHAPIYLIDPNPPLILHKPNLHVVKKGGSEGMRAVYLRLTA